MDCASFWFAGVAKKGHRDSATQLHSVKHYHQFFDISQEPFESIFHATSLHIFVP